VCRGPAPRNLQISLADLAVAEHLGGKVGEPGYGEGFLLHDAERVRRRAGPDDMKVLVHDDGALRQDPKDPFDGGWNRCLFGYRQRVLGPVADTKRHSCGQPDRGTHRRNNRQQEFHTFEFRCGAPWAAASVLRRISRTHDCSPILRAAFTVSRPAAG
jgi:hypothetical protein